MAAVDLATSAARVVGLAALAGAVAAIVALGFRWYTRERAPTIAALLAGLTTVALYLNVKSALGQVVAGEASVLGLDAVLYNGLALLVGGVAAAAGSRTGDRVATTLFAVSGGDAVEGQVSELVKAVGRVVTVRLPPEVEDIEGYDPVAPAVAEQLAGRTFVFPRGLSVDELRDRIAARIRDDYEVGYVDLDVTADGTVEYLAVGRRVAGIGPTLGPGTAAVAVRADPPNAASPGDVVQVFTDGDDPERVATAELRGTAGDVCTLAVDAADADRLAGNTYRLLTLPVEVGPEREFAAVVRAAHETMGAVRVAADGPLDGTTVGDVDATVAAVRGADGTVDPIPARSRTLAAGDTVYALGRPDVLRRLDAAADGTA